MKTSTLKLSMLLLALAMGFLPATAQQAAEGSVSIDVTVDENGQVSRQSETRSAEEASDLGGILEQYGLDKELESLAPGEEVEITIRRKQKEQVEKDIVVNIDRDFDREDITITEIEEEEMAKKPLLGVYYEVDPATQGGRITYVISNTAAEKAGLQEDDVIIEFDGTTIQGLASLQKAVAAREPGDKVTVEYLRDEVTIRKKVVLGKHNQRINYMWHRSGPDFPPAPPRPAKIDPNRPMLGIHVGNVVIVENGVETKNTEKGEGTYVSKVIEGTAAAELGLQEGDRVVAINGAEVMGREGIGEILKQSKVGDRITVEYLRDGQPKKGEATLTGWRQAPEQRFEVDFNSDAPGDIQIEMEEVNEMLKGLRANGTLHRREIDDEVVHTRTFSMVIRMEDVSVPEAEAMSARSGQDFATQSDLALDFFKVGPNPSNGMFNFSFELSQQGRTDLRVLDSNGTTVYEEDLGNFSGSYNKEFDISRFAKGIYYLQITQDGRAFTKKIVTQ